MEGDVKQGCVTPGQHVSDQNSVHVRVRERERAQERERRISELKTNSFLFGLNKRTNKENQN